MSENENIETLDQITEINTPSSEDEPKDEVKNENPAPEPTPDSEKNLNTDPQPEPEPQEKTDEDKTEDIKDEISKRLDEAFDALTEGKKEDETKPAQEQNKQPASDAEKVAQQQQKIEDQKEDKPKTEAEEEAEILNMAGNERTRKRFEKLLQERKEARNVANSFVEQIQGAGFDENTFAQVLEFGRLISYGGTNEKKHALQMLDQLRANLAADIGEEVPGVDLLKGFPDLQKEVGDMNLDRKRALEIAAARRRQAEYDQQQRIQVEQMQTRQRIESARVQMSNALLAHKDEPYFAEKINAVHQWLKTGDNLQHFINTVPPEQWQAQIERMISQLPAQFYMPSAQAKPRTSSPQPLRSRPMNTGNRDTSKMTVEQYIMEIMKDM